MTTRGIPGHSGKRVRTSDRCMISTDPLAGESKTGPFSSDAATPSSRRGGGKREGSRAASDRQFVRCCLGFAARRASYSSWTAWSISHLQVSTAAAAASTCSLGFGCGSRRNPHWHCQTRCRSGTGPSRLGGGESPAAAALCTVSCILSPQWRGGFTGASGVPGSTEGSPSWSDLRIPVIVTKEDHSGFPLKYSRRSTPSFVYGHAF